MVVGILYRVVFRYKSYQNYLYTGMLPYPPNFISLAPSILVFLVEFL